MYIDDDRIAYRIFCFAVSARSSSLQKSDPYNRRTCAGHLTELRSHRFYKYRPYEESQKSVRCIQSLEACRDSHNSADGPSPTGALSLRRVAKESRVALC